MIKQRLLYLSIFAATQVSVAIGAVLPQPASAEDCSGTGIAGGAECAKAGGSATDLLGSIQKITDILLLAVGVGAIIMIIVGGARYVFSGGNEKDTRAAKDTIVNSIIGLVIAILAYAIIHFVISRFQ